MKQVNIINATTEQRKLIFKICRENGYTIGRMDSSDDSIQSDFLICKEEKAIFHYCHSYDEKTISFDNLNISKLVKWLNGKDDILDFYFPKQIILKAGVVGKDITIYMGEYKGYKITFA